MSGLKEVLAKGDLDTAIALAISEVKEKPTDAEARYRLFALVAFSGDLHRARRQLTALGVGDEQMERAKAAYINLLAAEQERRAVCHHGADPLLPPNSPEHLKLRLAALKVTDDDESGVAADSIGQAVDAQPVLRGNINGQPFTALRDMDDALGSVLELFAGGRHILLPFERIRKLEIEAPGHLLDLLWIPVKLTDRQGVESSVHLPVLYEGSSAAEDPRCTTGAMTEWFEKSAGVFRGCGQRILAWQDSEGQMQELPILALRRLSFEGAEQ